MDLKEGQFYSGIPGYTIKANEKITDELLKDVMIYDHVTYQGNNRVILSDSAYMYSIIDNRYLVFELHNGSSYTEIPVETSRVKYINQFYRNNFTFMKLIFDMSSFDLQRTKEELFAGDYRMKNTTELSNTIDSLEFNQSKQKYIMLKNSTSFYDFHMKDKFMLPEGVVKIRSEFKEDELVKDYYTNNKELINIEDSFYTFINSNLVLDNNTYSRALNSARNIKTNLSINSARIKSQKFEIKVPFNF